MKNEDNKLQGRNVWNYTKAPILINCGPFLDGKAKRRKRRQIKRKGHE